ncbi:MAG: superoxide dismutase, Ni [Nanoarchaeota archaeon]
MSILHTFFKAVEKVIPAKIVLAHCDVPCGIYDPHLAQVAAHTVYRMMTLVRDAKAPGPETSPADRAQYVHGISRYASTKEEHAEVCKRELRILWGDFFKPEHLEKYPDLHDKVWKAMKLAGKARQETHVETGKELIAAVNEIADMYWKCKGIATKTVKAPYPTEEPLVVPDLK